MTEFGHGLLIGKFYPPHRGHHAAIRAAAARCRRLTVLVMAGAVESIALSERLSWLHAEHVDDAGVRVLGVRCDAPLDVNDPRVWTAQVEIMRAALRTAGESMALDAVFGGENYIGELARRLGAVPVQVARSPLNASAIRCDLAAGWDDLAAPTRAGLTTRVVVVGAESTGTTTVAGELAEHYRARGGCWSRTACVGEYGRDYTRLKWDRHPQLAIDELEWDTDDFDVIAVEQSCREEDAARTGSPVLICDTDAVATAVWERRYLGATAREGQPWTRVGPRAVYLVTDHHGVPWHDDGLREGDLAVRAAMTGWFLDTLTAAGHSWVLLTGNQAQRLDIAVRTVDPLLNHRAQFGAPLRGPGFEATI